jgi:hypothetical protein
MTVWKTILLSLICLPAAVPVHELTNAWQLHSAIPQLRWLQLPGQRNVLDFFISFHLTELGLYFTFISFHWVVK